MNPGYSWMIGWPTVLVHPATAYRQSPDGQATSAIDFTSASLAFASA